MVPFFSRNFCDNGRYAFSAVVLLSAGNILPLMGLFDGAAYSRRAGPALFGPGLSSRKHVWVADGEALGDH